MKLAQALLLVSQLLEEIHHGTATGGSATTLVDSSLAVANGWFTGGTLFLMTGGQADYALPITSYTSGTTTFLFASIGLAVSAGRKYAAARSLYNRAALVDAINTALQEMGDLTQSDDSLVTIEDQEEYPLPEGVVQVTRVSIAQNADYPFDFKRNFNWSEAAGSLVFDRGLLPGTADRVMRVYYNAPHPVVSVDTDEISPSIHPLRLAWAAAYHASLLHSRHAANDDKLKDFVARAESQMQQKAVMHPIRNLQPDPHMSGY